MKIEIGSKLKGKVSLEQIMEDQYLRYYFFDYHKAKKPTLKDGELIVANDRVDMYFLFKIAERVGILSGVGEDKVQASAIVPQEIILIDTLTKK